MSSFLVKGVFLSRSFSSCIPTMLGSSSLILRPTQKKMNKKFRFESRIDIGMLLCWLRKLAGQLSARKVCISSLVTFKVFLVCKHFRMEWFSRRLSFIPLYRRLGCSFTPRPRNEAVPHSSLHYFDSTPKWGKKSCTHLLALAASNESPLRPTHRYRLTNVFPKRLFPQAGGQ